MRLTFVLGAGNAQKVWTFGGGQGRIELLSLAGTVLNVNIGIYITIF